MGEESARQTKESARQEEESAHPVMQPEGKKLTRRGECEAERVRGRQKRV